MPVWMRTLALLSIALIPSLGHAQEKARRPNILVAIADDWSYPYAGAYGSKFVKTPGFDRVAREGVLFHRGFVASPGCSPSRAALLTGRQPWQLQHAGTHASSFPGELVVYPNLLARAGYVVGLTGKGWGPGNFQITRWPNNPAGPPFDAAKTAQPPASGISRNDYAGNFRAFLAQRPKDQPFCFWFGGTEPHRPYEKGSGLKAGKKLEDAEVPAFLPDAREVRSDLLDYALEIEWFDAHLVRMIQVLEEMGELDNTIIVVTADNGMSFPRAKANLYEHGIHVPLAIRWGNATRRGLAVDDLVSLIDLAPTFLEAAGLKPPPQMVGKSLWNLLTSTKVEPREVRDRVFAGRERHSSARPQNLGYPCRAIRTADYLFIRNFAPERWPAGDPHAAKGEAIGYYDIDEGPTKTFLFEKRADKDVSRFFELATARRPAEELFDLRKDPAALANVAGKAEYATVRHRLRADLEAHLRATEDPHLLDQGAVFETYPRYSPIRSFPGDK